MSRPTRYETYTQEMRRTVQQLLYWEANDEVSDDDYARHESCRTAIAERICNNPECKEYGTCFVDYQLGDPCEFCGKGLGQ